MNMRWVAAVVGTMVLAGAGCADKPHEYGQERPPVDQIDSRDKGLQSKDVVSAADQMANDLLSDPNLNASKTQWLVVVDNVENKTVNSRFDLDIFLQTLQSRLAQKGRGRVQLIENRQKLRELQSKELEGEREDTPPGAPGPKGIQPDYSLYCTITELPNRGTSFYVLNFKLTDLRNRTIAWQNSYEVKVAR